jgi:hypothetical protein
LGGRTKDSFEDGTECGSWLSVDNQAIRTVSLATSDCGEPIWRLLNVTLQEQTATLKFSRDKQPVICRLDGSMAGEPVCEMRQEANCRSTDIVFGDNELKTLRLIRRENFH